MVVRVRICEVSDIDSPILREVLAYWTTKRTEQPLPARSNFDPLVEVPRLVPHLMLAEYHSIPPRFRFRVVGTSVVDCMGEDRTGKWVDADQARTDKMATDKMGADQIGTNQIARLLSSSVEQNGPTYGHASFQTPNGLWVTCRWLNLPMASDGVIIDRILGSMVQVPCQVSLSRSLPQSEQDIWSIRLPPL
jgi:hypothetical protein